MLASGARLLGMLSCTVSLLGCRVRGLDSGGDACFGVGCMAYRRVLCLVYNARLRGLHCECNASLGCQDAWYVVLCSIFVRLLRCKAWKESEVMLVSVLGCMACRRVRCLVFDAG